MYNLSQIIKDRKRVDIITPEKTYKNAEVYCWGIPQDIQQPNQIKVQTGKNRKSKYIYIAENDIIEIKQLNQLFKPNLDHYLNTNKEFIYINLVDVAGEFD